MSATASLGPNRGLAERVMPRTQQPDAPLGMRIEVRRDLNWTPDDLAALDAIIDTRPTVAPFMSQAWLSCLIAELPPSVDPAVLMFRDGRELCGVVPLAVRQAFGGTRVALLCSGSVPVDLVATRGYEPACADLLFEWLDDTFGRAGYVLELRDVPADSALWGAIRRAIEEKQRPFVLVPSEVYALPYLRLEERDAGSPRERAHKVRAVARQQRLLERRGEVSVEVLQDVAEVLGALDTLAGMLRARWGAGLSALDPKALEFHRRVVPLLLSAGRLRMMQMCVDRRPVAVTYLVTAGAAGGHPRWFGYYTAGLDREWAGRIHLGRLALVASLELAEREGAQEFDFLKGSQRYKYYWPVRERTTIDANLYSGTSRTQVTRATHEGRHVAAALFKSVRGLLPSDS